MRAPFSLRWALAWAALTGNYVEISVATYRSEGVTYRFFVTAPTVRRWKAELDRRRQAKEAEVRREADRLAEKEAEERDS